MYIREDTLLSRRSLVSPGPCIKPCGCPRHKQTNKHHAEGLVDPNRLWVCGCVGVYTKSKTSELSPLRRKLLREGMSLLCSCSRVLPGKCLSNRTSATAATEFVTEPSGLFSMPMLGLLFLIMWYYCAVTGESKKIVFTSGATEKITSGGATSDLWSPHK
jgi:hypothetical protein